MNNDKGQQPNNNHDPISLDQAGGAGSTSTNPTGKNYASSENAKISSPKYWLTVLGILALYVLLEAAASKLAFISVLIFLAWLVVLVICYRFISRMKAAGQDTLTKQDKYKMVAFMSADPVIAQAFYYYRLKKSLPQTADTALKIGWKVFFLQLLPPIILFFVVGALTATPALQKNSWYNSESTLFVSRVQAIGYDVNNVTHDMQSQNATQLQVDCQQLKTDVTSLEQIPAYPVQSTAAKISQGETALATGATDCLNGLNQKSSSLIIQANNNFVTGLNDLDAIHTAVTTK